MTNEHEVECCTELDALVADHDTPLSYSPRAREWLLKFIYWEDMDVDWRGFGAGVTIDYCPSCGRKLPESLRARYIQELESLGIEGAVDPEVWRPEAFRSDQWWKERNL